MLHCISLKEDVESLKMKRVDYNKTSSRRRPSYLPGFQTVLPLRTNEQLRVRREIVAEMKMDSVFSQNVYFKSKV